MAIRLFCPSEVLVSDISRIATPNSARYQFFPPAHRNLPSYAFAEVRWYSPKILRQGFASSLSGSPFSPLAVSSTAECFSCIRQKQN